MMHHGDVFLRDAVKEIEIGPRGFGDGDDPPRVVRGCPQKNIPEREIEPAEIFGMPLVLQIMKDSHVRHGSEDWRGEAGVQQHVELVAGRFPHQHGLLPKNSRGTILRMHGLLLPMKIRLVGDQVLAGFQVPKHKILVCLIDPSKSCEQFSQVHFGAADSAGNEVKRVDPEIGRAHV